MKKLLAVLAVLALVMGCATVKDWVCANRVTIENAVARAQATVDSIDAIYPELIPPEWRIVKEAAYAVIATGKNFLDTKVCPTAEDVTVVETKQATMQVTTKAAAKVTLMRTKGKTGK